MSNTFTAQNHTLAIGNQSQAYKKDTKTIKAGRSRERRWQKSDPNKTPTFPNSQNPVTTKRIKFCDGRMRPISGHSGANLLPQQSF